MYSHELVSDLVLMFGTEQKLKRFAHNKPLVSCLMTSLNRTRECFVLEQQHDVLNQAVLSQTVFLIVRLSAKFNQYKNPPIKGKVERDFWGSQGERETQKRNWQVCYQMW